MGFAQDLVNAGYTGYIGWGDAEAQADFNATGGAGKGSGSLGGGGGGGFNFNFEAAVDQAFAELGDYYTSLLDDAQGDLDLALARLQEDYDTGKRFRMQNFELSGQAIDLAQEAFSRDAEQAFRTQRTRQLARGINRQSAFDPNVRGERGIADVEDRRLQGNIDLGQKQIDLKKAGLETGFNQAGELADINLARGQFDLPEQFSDYKTNLEELKKKDAAQMALSKQQKAYNLFEASLV